VHYAIPHATSAWIAREMLRETSSDVKVITTLHGTDITIVGQDPSFHPITKFSIEKSDRITAVSQFLRQETFHAFGCTACDVKVIYNFIDPAIYDRAIYPPILREQLNGERRDLAAANHLLPSTITGKYSGRPGQRSNYQAPFYVGDVFCPTTSFLLS